MEKAEYIKLIEKMLERCNDMSLLDLIYKLLVRTAY